MTKSQIAETIAEITNLKALEVYRNPSVLTQEARVTIDGHLIDLSTRLVKALDLIPDTEPANDPEPEPTSEGPSTEQAPVPDAAEGKEPTSKPVSGGELALPNKADRHPVADEIEAYMENNLITSWKAAKQFHLSGQTVLNILSGASPSPKPSTLKRIRAIIGKTKKKNRAVSVPAPESHIQPPGPKGPIQFVQLKLAAWMGLEHLGNKEASEALGICEAEIRRIQNGLFPPEHILRQLAKKIPQISTNLGFLISSVKAQ